MAALSTATDQREGSSRQARELETGQWVHIPYLLKCQIDTVLLKWQKMAVLTVLPCTEQSYYPAPSKPRVFVLDAFSGLAMAGLAISGLAITVLAITGHYWPFVPCLRLGMARPIMGYTRH